MRRRRAHGAWSRHIEESVGTGLQSQSYLFGDVFLVDELRHGIEAENGGDVVELEIAADRAVDIVSEGIHGPQNRRLDVRISPEERAAERVDFGEIANLGVGPVRRRRGESGGRGGPSGARIGSA